MPAFFLFLLCLFCINTEGYSQSGFITGRVYSQATKATLVDAKLILKKNNKYFCKTKTDHVGNYWFGDLKKGSYSVWVVHEGYCQLEMDKIELTNNEGSIQLDLGLMENAANSNVATNSKVYMVYNEPIQVNLNEATTAYQTFQNEIHIINEVYQGNEIRIAPKAKPSPAQNNRATHYYDSFKGLEKTTSMSPY